MKLLHTLLLLCLFLPLAANGEEGPPERADVPEEFRWDLTDMYPDADAWEQDARRLDSLLEELEEYRGTLDEGGAQLYKAIEAYEAANQLLGNLYVYAGLSSFEDLRNSDQGARFSRARGYLARVNEASAFLRPELLAIQPERLESMIEETPELSGYTHWFNEQLRMRDFTLSEKEERILAAASDPLGKFNNVFAAFANADLEFEDVVDGAGNTLTMTQSRYGDALFSSDPVFRRNAWKSLFSAYQQWGNTLAANYEGHVKGRVFEARIRGFESAMQASTYRNGVPDEVYTNLIKALRENVAPLQRYLDLKRQALGLEVLEVWDSYAPVAEPPYRDIPWERAQTLVAEALAPLGDEYVEIYWKGFDEEWADVMESKGKRGGAYSWGTYSSKPYFSMNYQGNFSDVTTLAHEYGHSIHSYLSNANQPYVYSGYRIFIAEVASMTNEAILYQKMLKEAETREEKLFLLQSYLSEFRSAMYRQASLADFELQAHTLVENGEALTRDTLDTLYAQVFEDYYGDSLHTDPLNDSEWSRIPHLLRTDNFYVYQYATSFVAATALAKQILAEGEPARQRFLALLKSGSSDYPVDLLKKAGVDMTTSQPVLDTVAVMEALVDEFEAVLNSRP